MARTKSTILLEHSNLIYSMTMKQRMLLAADLAVAEQLSDVDWREYATCLGSLALVDDSASNRGILGYIKQENS